MTQKLLLIGWDAADWRVADPLIKEGSMPNLAKLIERGVRGNIRTLYPALSPMLWTSIATGKRPYKHGIHGFSEVCPETGGIRAISGQSRTTKAIWNILGQNSLKSNIVGWWPSHPAEPIKGCMVSNFFQHIPNKKEDFGDTLPNGTAYPKRLLKELSPLRIHPDEFNENHLCPFIPNLREMDWEKDIRVHSCARILAECSSIHSAATGLMQLEAWDFMGVYYDAIDHFSHGFMKYHSPQRKGIKDEDFANFKEVVNSAYRYHDLMLGTLLKLVDKDTSIILISDHGFHPNHLRPESIPSEPAGPAAEHRAQGIFVAAGPNIIHKDEDIKGISLLDITPTILHHYGLAIGEDMDGSVLEEIFSDAHNPSYIPSWDKVSGDDGSYQERASMTSEETQAAIKQLVELGYIDKPNENLEIAQRETQRELDYNLARAYMDGQHCIEAKAILRKLWKENPTEFRFGMQLLSCLEQLQQKEEAQTLIKEILQAKKTYAKENKERINIEAKKLQERIKAGEDVPKKEIRKMKNSIRTLGLNHEALAQLKIRSQMLNQDVDAALKKAQEAIKQFPQSLNLLLLNARLYIQKNRWKEANCYYQKVLSIEPEHDIALLGLAFAALNQKRFWEAAAYAQNSIALAPQNPWGHYYLGCALLRLSKPDLGLKELHKSVKLNPDFVEAWKRLSRFFSRARKRPNAAKRAAYYKKQANEASQRLEKEISRSTSISNKAEETAEREALLEQKIKALKSNPVESKYCHHPRTITIVSGLPRSGSSLMMQMLRAGGIEPLTDNLREADENNPKGFFEYDPVKSGKNYAEWMHQARGKSVKIISPLLRAIPRQERYQVIFCYRPLNQVLSSQAKMVKRLDKDNATENRPLRNSFIRQINQSLKALQKAGIPTLVIDYTDTIKDPHKAAESVNHFLGGNLNVKAMGQTVDPSLHREK